MMTTNQKKMMALATIGLLWGGILAWEWLTMEEPVRVSLMNVSGPAARSLAPRGTGDGLHVQLDLLAAARTQREMTFTTPRNIFASLRPDDLEAARANQSELDNILYVVQTKKNLSSLVGVGSTQSPCTPSQVALVPSHLI